VGVVLWLDSAKKLTRASSMSASTMADVTVSGPGPHRCSRRAISEP
jgi:hypothetical protein